MLLAISLMGVIDGSAQGVIEKGKLYHIYASGNKENVLTEKKNNAVWLTDLEEKNAAQ